MASEAWQQYDCYKILGVHVEVNPLEIRKAYYRASRDAHPDRGGSHEAQVRINLAYEVLSDPVQRQAHDLFWYRRAPVVPRREAPRAGRPGEPPEPAGEAPLGALLHRVEEALGIPRGVAAPRPDVGEARVPAAARPPAPPAAGPSARPHPPAPRGRQRGARWAFAAASSLTGLSLGGWLSDLVLEGRLGHMVVADDYPALPVLWGAAATGWMMFLAAGLAGSRRRAQPAAGAPRRPATGPEPLPEPRRAAVGEGSRDPRLVEYVGGIAYLGGLLMRATAVEDSEDQMARRITAALFVMGYKPLGYDRRYRLLLFTDDEERLLIRFRHRSGAAINVTFVQGMIEAMEYTGATQGILFVSTGLSGNGAILAGRHGVKWYTLDRMNDWIESVIRARYAGPPGDILRLLDHIVGFVRNLSTPLPTVRAEPRRSAGPRS
jgi:hypothetical protein